jgi:hypothetical protein
MDPRDERHWSALRLSSPTFLLPKDQRPYNCHSFFFVYHTLCSFCFPHSPIPHIFSISSLLGYPLFYLFIMSSRDHCWRRLVHVVGQSKSTYVEGERVLVHRDSQRAGVKVPLEFGGSL